MIGVNWSNVATIVTAFCLEIIVLFTAFGIYDRLQDRAKERKKKDR